MASAESAIPSRTFSVHHWLCVGLTANGCLESRLQRSFTNRLESRGDAPGLHELALSAPNSYETVGRERCETNIVVTTTPGTQIAIPISAKMLEKFVNELANHVESNFVAVAAAPAGRAAS